MTIPVSFVLGPLAAANAALIAASQTPVSGTPLTLTGATVALDKPRRVLLTYGSEASARTLIVTGANADGNPIQETLAVPAGGSGTVYTVQDFATIISALPAGGGWTAAATLGTNTVASSPWKFVNIYYGPIEIAFSGIVSGTINWGIEYTYQDANNNLNTLGSQALGNYPTPPSPWNHATMVNLAGSQDGVSNEPFRAWRAKINSGTGSVAITAIESGIIVQR
jgi:hypothetical protein